MRSVRRSIAAVVAGFVVASIVMMIVEFTNGRVFYPELAKAAEGIMHDRESQLALIANAPIETKRTEIDSESREKLRALMASAPVGALLIVIAGIVNNLMIPPPIWFWFASLFVLLPAVYAGTRPATRSSRPQP